MMNDFFPLFSVVINILRIIFPLRGTEGKG